jgi:hypothetical protein
MKRDLATVTIALLFVFAATPFLQAQQVAQKGPTPEETIAEIKKAAAELIKSDSASLKKPVFGYTNDEKGNDGRVLEYYLGGVRTGSFELQADDPYLLVFEKQIQIEVLRDLFKNKTSVDEEYWGPPLALAEQLYWTLPATFRPRAVRTNSRRKSRRGQN